MSCIEEHALSAAFHDPRFPPVTAEELEAIDIEISVLTVPEELTFNDGEDLKGQLEPDVHGVILSSGLRRSTFLPQVWKQLPETEAFLQHLCVKGGMPGNAWQDPETKVQVYRVEAFGEKDPDMGLVGSRSQG
jgi:AmmeMemoRadiSam system protein A